MKNFYEVLGVTEQASQDEIKKAYKKAAVEAHPDKHGGDDTKMKDLNEAWSYLKTPEKRQEYDQTRRGPQFNPGRHPGGRPGNGFRGARGFGVHGEMSEDLRNFFNEFGHPKPKNQDVAIRVILNIKEVFEGKKINVDVNLPEGGSSHAEINIPAGIPNGTRIKFDGLGSKKLKDQPPGNLYATVLIEDDPVFKIQGRDLVKVVEDLSILDVMLGCKKDVECIDGKTVKVSIPEGASRGQMVRVRGKGMPVPGSTSATGDMLLVLDIKTPVLNKEEKEKLRELQDGKRIH